MTKSTKIIPYMKTSSTASIHGQVTECAAVSGGSMLWFVFRRLRSYVLGYIAYFAPINSARVLCHRWRGVKIGRNVHIGFHCVLDHSYPEYITLEDEASLSGEVYILAHSQPKEHFRGRLLSYIAPVVVQRGAWLTIRSTVLPGVTVGEDAVVSAGAVVTKSVPAGAIVAGNPAQVVRQQKSSARKRPA